MVKTPKAEKLKNKSVVNTTPPKRKRGKNGGARPGAGRPKGKMNAASIEKMKVKQAFQERVAKNADRLFNAQFNAALGETFVFRRIVLKTGKKKVLWSRWEIVKSAKEIVKFMNEDYDKTFAEYRMITAEKGNMQAIDSMLDRTFGKAPQDLKIKDDRRDPIGELLTKFGLLPDQEEGDNARETEETPSASS